MLPGGPRVFDFPSAFKRNSGYIPVRGCLSSSARAHAGTFSQFGRDESVPANVLVDDRARSPPIPGGHAPVPAARPRERLEFTIVDTTAFEAAATTGGGKTVIADGVIAKIVGIAAREVPGVFALGGNGVRALGAIRDALTGTDLTQGVSIDVDEDRVTVEVALIVEYPHELQTVAAEVRDAITDVILTIVGMQVTAVDVTVKDVHHASANADDDPETVVPD